MGYVRYAQLPVSLMLHLSCAPALMCICLQCCCDIKLIMPLCCVSLCASSIALSNSLYLLICAVLGFSN